MKPLMAFDMMDLYVVSAVSIKGWSGIDIEAKAVAITAKFQDIKCHEKIH